MARPATISTEAILEAARRLFLERGPGVATAEIARQLGISEGSIFKRFRTKHQLFLAAMGVKQPAPWTRDLDQLVGQGSLRENLVAISVDIINFIRELLPRMMHIWSYRGGPVSSDPAAMHHEGPRRGLMALSSYLQREMDRGRIRRADPEVTARIFLGSLWNLVFMETIEGNEERVDPEVYAHKLVDTLWAGLAPREESTT